MSGESFSSHPALLWVTFFLQHDLSKKLTQIDQDIVEARAQVVRHLLVAVQVLVRARGE